MIQFHNSHILQPTVRPLCEGEPTARLNLKNLGSVHIVCTAYIFTNFSPIVLHYGCKTTTTKYFLVRFSPHCQPSLYHQPFPSPSLSHSPNHPTSPALYAPLHPSLLPPSQYVPPPHDPPSLPPSSLLPMTLPPSLLPMTLPPSIPPPHYPPSFPPSFLLPITLPPSLLPLTPITFPPSSHSPIKHTHNGPHCHVDHGEVGDQSVTG